MTDTPPHPPRQAKKRPHVARKIVKRGVAAKGKTNLARPGLKAGRPGHT